MKYFEQYDQQQPDLEKRPLSYSSLKAFLKSPIHYIEYINKKREQTDAMLLGSLVDCMIFTPDDLESSYKRYEKFSKRSNADKERWQLMQDEASSEGFEWIDSELWDKALLMVDSVMNHPEASHLIHQVGASQRKMEWSRDGLPFVGVADGIGQLGENASTFILDLKTSTDASAKFWQRQLLNMEYHLQAAMYVEGWKRERFEDAVFYHIVVENTAPFTVNVFKLSEEIIQAGRDRYLKAIEGFKTCQNQNSWDEGYSFWQEPNQVMELASWYKA